MKQIVTVLVVLVSLMDARRDRHFRPSSPTAVSRYIYNVSVKRDPIQDEIYKQSSQLQNGRMIGAAEVVQLGQNLLHLIQAKRAIDIGTFTGSSAVAWALALPSDGEVLTIDVNPEYYDMISRNLISARPDISSKIKRHIGPALEKLDSMLASGEAGKWDFVFIDADKNNYPRYYEQAVDLLRPGGVILVDNALWGGRVANPGSDISGVAIDEMNQKAAKDSRVHNYLVNVGDGAHMIFKKHGNTGA